MFSKMEKKSLSVGYPDKKKVLSNKQLLLSILGVGAASLIAGGCDHVSPIDNSEKTLDTQTETAFYNDTDSAKESTTITTAYSAPDSATDIIRDTSSDTIRDTSTDTIIDSDTYLEKSTDTSDIDPGFLPGIPIE